MNKVNYLERVIAKKWDNEQTRNKAINKNNTSQSVKVTLDETNSVEIKTKYTSKMFNF